jgi:hypothetical protein
MKTTMPPTIYGLTVYEKLIAKATSASDTILPILENIMRDEVFHSTLDWQDDAQFTAGARRALRIFLSNRRLYETEAAFHQARFLRIRSEQALAAARASGDPDAVRVAAVVLDQAGREEAAAGSAFDACLGLGG